MLLGIAGLVLGKNFSCDWMRDVWIGFVLNNGLVWAEKFIYNLVMVKKRTNKKKTAVSGKKSIKSAKGATKSTGKKQIRPQNDPVVEVRNRLEDVLEARELAFLEEEKHILAWEAPSRPFKQRSKEFFTTIGALVILVAIILLFVREFLLLAVLLAFMFVAYVFASVEPETVEHEITTRGFRTGGKFYRWDVLTRFWFEEKYGQRVLAAETLLQFPSRILMLLGNQDEEEMKQLLMTYMLYEKPEETFMDKSVKWVQKKVPLED